MALVMVDEYLWDEYLREIKAIKEQLGLTKQQVPADDCTGTKDVFTLTNLKSLQAEVETIKKIPVIAESLGVK